MTVRRRDQLLPAPSPFLGPLSAAPRLIHRRQDADWRSLFSLHQCARPEGEQGSGRETGERILQWGKGAKTARFPSLLLLLLASASRSLASSLCTLQHSVQACVAAPSFPFSRPAARSDARSTRTEKRGHQPAPVAAAILTLCRSSWACLALHCLRRVAGLRGVARCCGTVGLAADWRLRGRRGGGCAQWESGADAEEGQNTNSAVFRAQIFNLRPSPLRLAPLREICCAPCCACLAAAAAAPRACARRRGLHLGSGGD